MRQLKGQALFLVFFLLMTVAVLGAALAVMLRSDMYTSYLGREGTAAFYLAQAGVERAKAELRYSGLGWGWTGPANEAFPGGGTYSVTVAPAGGNRIITAIGRFRKSERQIQVTVQNSPYQQVPGTWGEI
ncbi:MAG: hypothetical protein ABIH27_05815 [Candidatus Omnitrophota bacterium]